MKITNLSTKGQVVIPEEMRKGLEVGTPFFVTRQNGLIILKVVEGLTKKEMKEMKELDKIWKEIDEGKCTTLNVEDFFKDMNKW